MHVVLTVHLKKETHNFWYEYIQQILFDTSYSQPLSIFIIHGSIYLENGKEFALSQTDPRPQNANLC